MKKFKELFESGDVRLPRKVWDEFDNQNNEKINMVKSQWNKGKSIFHIKKFSDEVVIFIEPKSADARKLMKEIRSLVE